MDAIPYECMSNVYLSKKKKRKNFGYSFYYPRPRFLGETCALLVHIRVKGEVMNSILYEGMKNV